MATNATNDIVSNFYRRFRRYLRHRYELDGKEAYEVLKLVQDKTYTGDNEIVKRYRSKLSSTFYTKRLEDVPESVMTLQYEILRYFEESQTGQADRKAISKSLRLFSLLPTKQGFECSHFKMCTNGLQGLLKRAKMTVPAAQAAWRQTAPDFWRRLFNIEKFETDNRKFAGEILTDGKAVSVVMRKPKKASTQQQPLSLDSYDTVWGLDPGRTDTFVATSDTAGKKSCSTKEFYNDSGYKASNKTIRHWQQSDQAVSEAIKNMPTKKTASLDKLGTYIDFVLRRIDLLLDFHQKKGFRKLKLRRYILSEKKLRQMCLELASLGQKTLVGFGDWSATDSAGLIKKSPAGPVKKLERRLRQYCTVISIDEFRSSKLHHVCHRPMTNSYNQKKSKKDGEWRRSKVHSVLHCRHSGCSGMTMNRDSNASRNILMLLKLKVCEMDRPVQFCRGTLLEECLRVPESSGLGGHLQTAGT